MNVTEYDIFGDVEQPVCLYCFRAIAIEQSPTNLNVCKCASAPSPTRFLTPDFTAAYSNDLISKSGSLESLREANFGYSGTNSPLDPCPRDDIKPAPDFDEGPKNDNIPYGLHRWLAEPERRSLTLELQEPQTRDSVFHARSQSTASNCTVQLCTGNQSPQHSIRHGLSTKSWGGKHTEIVDLCGAQFNDRASIEIDQAFYTTRVVNAIAELAAVTPMNGHLNRFQVVYDVQWELFSFMTNFFPVGHTIGDIVTVTGDRNEAFATSARNYLATMYPMSGILILKVLEESFTSKTTGKLVSTLILYGQ